MSFDCVELDKLAKNITQWRQEKGFVTPSTIKGDDADLMLGKLMLVVTEIAEAAEAVRYNQLDNFKVELADAVIRILDISGAMSFSLSYWIAHKMAMNKVRPNKHGKKTNL